MLDAATKDGPYLIVIGTANGAATNTLTTYM
jgi:hypothetical protein